MNVSQAPAREALRALQALGLLDAEPNRARLPAGDDVAEGILRGLYRYRAAESPTPAEAPRFQLLASGAAVRWALVAQRLLGEEWGVATDVRSAPSWTEPRRGDGLRCAAARVPCVTRALVGAPGPGLAVSDWMRPGVGPVTTVSHAKTGARRGAS